MIQLSPVSAPDYSDAASIAAVAAHRIADVAVAGTVTDRPVFFTGHHTHSWHERRSIL